MSDILTHVTGEQLRYAPELEIYIELVHESGFDPEMLWFPCECLGAFDNQHVDSCWLGWIAYPVWMKEPTSEVAIIERELGGRAGGWCAPAETLSYCGHPLSANCGCTVEPAGEPLDLSDEDETTYFERHHYEPTSDVDDDSSKRIDGEPASGTVDS